MVGRPVNDETAEKINNKMRRVMLGSYDHVKDAMRKGAFNANKRKKNNKWKKKSKIGLIKKRKEISMKRVAAQENKEMRLK